ncbi:MAG: hypothetical protein M1819_001200 [Sarea resinae]|nr:MAG: hypothetical protein M1819_001200 [Sarea resinae]
MEGRVLFCLGVALELTYSQIRRDSRPENAIFATKVRSQQPNHHLRSRTGYEDLEDIITKRTDLLLGDEKVKKLPLVQSLNLSSEEYERMARRFKATVMAIFNPDRSDTKQQLLKKLRTAFVDQDYDGLDDELKYEFFLSITKTRLSKADVKRQRMLADLRYPIEWYPGTREMQRTIHLHVGPTNSGKTYHALKKLEAAKSGVYAGPLKLLAHEVYTRLSALGRPCNLITGDHRIIEAKLDQSLSTCTVEMIPLNVNLDVAVIDEVQMLAHDYRGWAWTQALLGVKAKEVHLCGEERAVPLVRELAVAMGDKLEMHHYKRLSPLKMMSTSLEGDLKKLRKGDCIVVFSRKAIHAMKREIERLTGKRVAMVYGSLPPETRAQQAKLFNDPDNEYDILVASDAIGMGLNLNIKRIIFESVAKNNGITYSTLDVSNIKQIAGRAGRYRTAEQATAEARPKEGKSIAPAIPPTKSLGLVTTMEKFDLRIVQQAMDSEADSLKTAGIFPPYTILEQFAGYFPPETPFSYILLRLHELSKMHPRFHLCSLQDQIFIADLIHNIKGLTISDRATITAAPLHYRDPLMPPMMEAFAKSIASQRSCSLLDYPEINLEVLDEPQSRDPDYLKRLESLHGGMVLYLWLSYRFPGVFPSRPLAMHVRESVERRIDNVLDQTEYNPKFMAKNRRLREESVLRDLTLGSLDEKIDSKAAAAHGQSEDADVNELSEEPPEERKAAVA